MNVNEFIEKYKNSVDQDKFLKKHIIDTYTPYTNKISDCERIVSATTTIDGVFKQNTPASFMLFVTTLINRYTDIEISENIVQDFEKLDEIALVDQLLVLIPERELSSYNTILDMIKEDFYVNNRDLVSFIETKVAALQLTGNTLIDGLNELIIKSDL